MKKMMDYMEEANAVVPRISGADAVAHISDGAIRSLMCATNI